MKRIHYKDATLLLLLLIISAFLFLPCGIAIAAGNKSTTGNSSQAKLRTPLSLARIHEIQKNLPRLKAGMTEKRVLLILGLTQYSNSFGAMSSGPTNDYLLIYSLRKGYSLTLVYDFTKRLSRFKRAALRKPYNSIYAKPQI